KDIGPCRRPGPQSLARQIPSCPPPLAPYFPFTRASLWRPAHLLTKCFLFRCAQGHTAMAILLVERYAPLARALMRGLQEEGFTPHWTRDDLEAGGRLRATPYAAAVVGWNAPRHGGAALVRSWRHAGLTVPVLLLMPSASDADRRAGLAAGADEILPLPFAFED